MRCPFSRGYVGVFLSRLWSWRASRPLHPAELFFMPGNKKTRPPACNHRDKKISGGRGSSCAFRWLPGRDAAGRIVGCCLGHLCALKQWFPIASWLPKKTGRTGDVTDWPLTWKDIKWKDLASGGSLSRELVGGETKSFPNANAVCSAASWREDLG